MRVCTELSLLIPRCPQYLCFVRLDNFELSTVELRCVFCLRGGAWRLLHSSC
jgi:hypothetical protein